jgi:hypothetical protein
MYEKISERSGGKYYLRGDRHLPNLTPQIALDDRIDELADLIRQHYGLSDLGDPSASTDVGTIGAVSAISLSSSLRKPLLLLVASLSMPRLLLALAS